VSGEPVQVLNLGCGYMTSDRCINIDWSLPVRLRGSRVGRRLAPMILTGDRRKAYDAMQGEVMSHDLRKGIPFADATVDAVYHSHVLEHLDRDVVPGFLAEVRRVLRPGGVHRIVVPDLETLARSYVASLEAVIDGTLPPEEHEASIHTMIEQLVRREAYGTALRTGFRRRLENLVLGDARKRGETHQWMWDRVSLPHELLVAGFHDPQIVTNSESRIPDWRGYQLDETPNGDEYKPGSLYVEAIG
jgi:SAM-dependent methyltransferase